MRPVILTCCSGAAHAAVKRSFVANNGNILLSGEAAGLAAGWGGGENSWLFGRREDDTVVTGQTAVA